MIYTVSPHLFIKIFVVIICDENSVLFSVLWGEYNNFADLTLLNLVAFIVNNSYIHLGVYYRDNFAGVLQFGYALNPACAGKIVEGTVQGEYLELNRMWLADVCPRNSESMAISYAVKYIRRASPSVAWIQSFADERCGRLGVVYQASNFLYLGCHVSPFYFLDGDYYHNILMTAHRKSGGRGRMLRENKKRAIPLAYRQFRYVLFLKQSWRKRLRLKVQPYPKPEA